MIALIGTLVLHGLDEYWINYIVFLFLGIMLTFVSIYMHLLWFGFALPFV